MFIKKPILFVDLYKRLNRAYEISRLWCVKTVDEKNVGWCLNSSLCTVKVYIKFWIFFNNSGVIGIYLFYMYIILILLLIQYLLKWPWRQHTLLSLSLNRIANIKLQHRSQPTWSRSLSHGSAKLVMLTWL